MRPMSMGVVSVVAAASMIAGTGWASAEQATPPRVVPAGGIAPRPMSDLDTRRTGSAVEVGTRVIRARAALGRTLGTQGVLQSDPTTGTLRFVGRLDGFLTKRANDRPARIVMRYLREHRLAFGLRGRDLRTLRLRDDYVDALGTHHLSFVQRAGGLTLFGQGIRAAVAADGRLVNVTGGPLRGLRAPAGGPTLRADDALAAARTSVGAISAPARTDRAKLMLFPTGRGARLAWRTFTRISPVQTDVSFVDARSGEILYRHNLTDSGAPVQVGTAEAWPFYPSSIPPGGGGVEQPVTFPVFDGTQLFGPNAWVFKDVLDDSVPDPSDQVPASSGLDWSAYDAPLDTTTTQQNCSPKRACTWDRTQGFSWKANIKHNAVQIYYFLNHFHDHLASAPISFTNAAGNFEMGGTGGDDPVLGNASDGANTAGNGFPDLGHVDNANMFTPPDGSPPVMQMYLFEKLPRFGLGRIPSANGGDDAEVVYHEYTHGLSNRLVIYPDGLSGLDSQQAGSMGEGWSDWYALDLLRREGYKPDTAAVGDVVMGQLSFAGQLRTQPVDCPVGPAQGRCTGTDGAGPGGYTYGDFGRILGGPEVHADGEIWAQTLWELRDALGSNATEELVTRGMELSPPSPSFLDMRNAIVQADLVANGGANAGVIWSVFAGRGMGFFASSVGGSDVHPVEDFALPPDCASDPCGTIEGTVTDAVTGDPVQGVTVRIAGLASGFASDLADTSNASGAFQIADVPFHDAYPALQIVGGGYEPKVVRDVVVDGTETVDPAVFFDFAALNNGADLGAASPPDYAEFCGVGADGAFDLDLGTGWPSDAVGSDVGSNYTGPRRVVVRLVEAVDVIAFGVASGGACGDGPEAGVKHFLIQTKRTRNERWRTAIDASTGATGRLRAFDPRRADSNVRFIRFVMLSNHGDPLFMDVLEVTVRGRPA
ncbi:MAG TPA: M36 family metallopeptidase [Actinomycetota bacterium]